VERFAAAVQTGPGAHPASYRMRTFPGVKRPGRGDNYPPQSKSEVKDRPSWPVLGVNFTAVLVM
jgi:hypothetical protein